VRAAVLLNGHPPQAEVPRGSPPRRLRRAREPQSGWVEPPPEWWHETQMRRALATRDIGTVLHRLHQHHGLSLRAIGARTGLAQSQITAILQGRKVCRYDILARIADGLSIPRGLMGMAYTDHTPSRRPRRDPPPEPSGRRADRRPVKPPVGVRLPTRWWKEPTMAEALAGHDFSTVFAYLSRHGLALGEIAANTGLPAHEIGSVIVGLSIVDSYRALVRLGNWLGIPRARLGVGTVDPTDPQPDPQLPAVWTPIHVRAVRRAARLSVRGLATVIGVTARCVAKWECLTRLPTNPGPDNAELLDALLCRLEPPALAVYHRLVQSEARQQNTDATATNGYDGAGAHVLTLRRTGLHDVGGHA
jgi:transcriptional regulator with XRE-family HTH domain